MSLAQLPAQRLETAVALGAIERVCGFGCGCRGQGEHFAAERAPAAVAIDLLEFRPGLALGAVAQPIPAQGAAGVVDRRMRPGVRFFRARRIAGLAVGRARRGQAQGSELFVAGGEHPAQRRQVLAVLDKLPRRGEQHPRRQVAQALQPQPLGLIEQAGIGEGAVELVVVIDPEQREQLIDGVDQLRGRRAAVSWPSCGRRVLRGGREIACCLVGQAFAGFHAALPSLGC